MFIKVENDKVVRISSEEEKGFIEVEDNELLFLGQPLVYKKGKIAIDEDEIEHLNKSIEVGELKQKLTDTDYVVFKIAEGVATEKEYADILKDRAEWRARINELQKETGK